MKLKIIQIIVIMTIITLSFLWIFGSFYSNFNDQGKNNIGDKGSTEKNKLSGVADNKILPASASKSEIPARNQSEAINIEKIPHAEIQKLAKKRLDDLRIDYSGRECIITYDHDKATCAFPPPANARGGDFIVIINLKSGEIIDVKIWR
jgi:hypothetical protein